MNECQMLQKLYFYCVVHKFKVDDTNFEVLMNQKAASGIHNIR